MSKAKLTPSSNTSIKNKASDLPNKYYLFKSRKERDGSSDQIFVDKLGTGKPLGGNIKPKLEAALGHNFSEVQVHSNSKSEAILKRNNAFAASVGDHVLFPEKSYKPGSLTSDLLLSHELSHVVQQSETGETTAVSNFEESISPDSPATELDADRSALGVMGKLYSNLKMELKNISAKSKPALRTGLQFARCSRSRYPQLEPPDFLGEHSRKTFVTIRRRVESTEGLEDMLVLGPLIVVLTSAPEETLAGGGYPLEEQARAVSAIPNILKARVLQDIDLLLVMHGNELTEQETTYWNNIRRLFSR